MVQAKTQAIDVGAQQRHEMHSWELLKKAVPDMVRCPDSREGAVARHECRIEAARG